MSAKTLLEAVGQEKLDHICDQLAYLYARWQDEHEYEDFNDYKKRMEEVIGVPVEMTQKPFRVLFVAGGKKRYIRVTGNDIQYGSCE